MLTFFFNNKKLNINIIKFDISFFILKKNSNKFIVIINYLHNAKNKRIKKFFK